MSMREAHVAKWLRALGGLCASNMPAEEVAGKVTAYSQLLASRFPPEAFTAHSLEEVAAKCKFFPAYGELVQFVTEWWRDNRPAAQRFPAIAPPSEYVTPEPTDAERAAQARTMAAFMEEVGNRAKAAAARKPDPARPLHPEHLRRIRDADPLVQRARAINAAIKAEKMAAQAGRGDFGTEGSGQTEKPAGGQKIEEPGLWEIAAE